MKEKLSAVLRFFRRLGDSGAFQFATLFALLCRIVWRMWDWRDLSYGDTSNYYSAAMSHAAGGGISLVFSPLYVIFYSWFGTWFEDAQAATVLHRIIILLLCSVSLLLLFRAILPKPVAWLAAAWWLLLPIDWNALYEVHLFGLMVLAAGCWVMGLRPRLPALSLGLAVLWTGALLVRNEFLLSVALLAFFCILREFVRWKKGGAGFGRFALQIGLLALPSLLVTVVAAVALHKDWPGWKGLGTAFRKRHTVNVVQVYAFSYGQRHPE